MEDRSKKYRGEYFTLILGLIFFLVLICAAVPWLDIKIHGKFVGDQKVEAIAYVAIMKTMGVAIIATAIALLLRGIAALLIWLWESCGSGRVSL